MRQKYTTVRIPTIFAELIDKYMKEHKRELIVEGRRVSRANVVKLALHEFFEKEKMLEET